MQLWGYTFRKSEKKKSQQNESVSWPIPNNFWGQEIQVVFLT